MNYVGTSQYFSELVGLQDDVNWMAASVGLPSLTTWFLWRTGDTSMTFVLFHPFISAFLLSLFIKEKFLGLNDSRFDMAKTSITVATMCTIALTGR